MCGASVYVMGFYGPVDRTHNGRLLASQHAQDPTSATASASAWSPWGAGGGVANAAASMGKLKAYAYNQLVVGTGQQPDHHGRSGASAWFQDRLTPWSASYPGYSASLTLGFTIHGSMLNPSPPPSGHYSGASWACRVEDEKGGLVAYANSTDKPPGPGGILYSTHRVRPGVSSFLKVTLSVGAITDLGFYLACPVSSGTWDTRADYGNTVELTEIILEVHDPVRGVVRLRDFTLTGESGFDYTAEVRRPRVLSAEPAFGFEGSQFGFRVKAPVGQLIDIQTSTDLLHWVTVQAGTLESTPFEFKDPDSPRSPVRFYRVQSP